MSVPVPNAAADSLEELFGPADCTAVTGNGRLTVGVNGSGRITVCRWPSPGYSDQVDYRTRSRDSRTLGVPPEHGVLWAVRSGEETWPLTGPPFTFTQQYLGPASTVIETAGSLADRTGIYAQTLFVHPELDLLVARLTVTGLGETPLLYRYSNFAPCTRVVPELPLADWALDSWNDFAVFVDASGQAACQFRPNEPGSYEWGFAEAFAAGRTKATAWSWFGEGVWIVSRNAGSFADIHCGAATGNNSLLAQVNAGTLGGARAAAGQVASVIGVYPLERKQEYVATIFTAFAQTQHEADNVVATALERGYDRLFDETQAHWQPRITIGSFRSALDPDLADRCKRALLTIAMATDQYTGGIVRAPITQPPLALDWPRHGAWISLALDLAGHTDLAARHHGFYLDAIRKDAERGKPLGSLPAACYTNHTEATPHLFVDTEAAAWTLWSFSQHAEMLDADERTAYLGSVWEGVDLLGSFLAGWADARTGAPLFSFDPAVFRDNLTDAQFVATYLGMSSAVRMAQALGQDRPRWRTRVNELEPLVRFRSFDPDGSWRLEHPLVLALTGLLEPEDSRWEEALALELENLDGPDAVETARSLYFIAVHLKRHPEKRASVKPRFLETLRRVMPHATRVPDGSAFPDALRSALCFSAAATLAETGQ